MMTDYDSQLSDFDDPEKEDYLAKELANTPDNNGYFRPTLADDQKIGFFSLDRCVQTEKSEILDIKELTYNIHELLDDAASMKRDINFARNVMQADFEAKLQQKAIDLYVRVNEKISDIERMHGDRVATVRRAFRQQLSDAIARMKTHYTKNLSENVLIEQRRKEEEAKKWEMKFRDLQGTIQRNESIILMLRQQLSDFQQREDRASLKAPSPSVDYQGEIDGLNKEIQRIQDVTHGLEERLDDQNTRNAELVREIEVLREDLERERIMNDQLKHEKDEMQNVADSERHSGRQMMESQKLALEREIEERIRKAKEEEKSSQRDKTRITKEVEESQRSEQRMLAEIAKLKKEIDRVHRTWEKKFAILQQSLHALKDESFIRQTMQRQAATLHHASISYAPNIRGGKKDPQQENDLISYTVSAQSGRATAVFSQDENQVMSDNEQYFPPDVVPLPGPPGRLSACDMRRPGSAQQHVINVQ
ncbi:hypothetical protein CAPTEDRAFT_220477 [Capitella teleta]|uniref:DUF4709 domain-containing protein n=1 Tax=Capitella teleta TaxID=283909 RepID=R7UFL9_CAPTE|nr:hypothetical protein CAPTEDRAFT_220477 [Capitella teleta]|eukprot:ELU02583.1 hypothetical protein CAPTEDRAFT_220477 [Capitella teleta]